MNEIITKRKELRDKKIRAHYRNGLSMNDICEIERVSKTTVFFAIHGRSKKSVEDTSKRKALKRALSNPSSLSKINHKNNK